MSNKKDIGKYVNGYNMCQRMKNYTEAPVGKLMVNKVPEKSQTYLMVDFITKLLLVARKDAILVVCNGLSKIAYFVIKTKETSAKGLARMFGNNVQKLYELLESVILDRRPQFTVELTKKLYRMLDIKMKLLTLFYPQIDGQTKQMNQELEQYLQFFINYRQKNWPEWLVTAEFAVNNKIH